MYHKVQQPFQVLIGVYPQIFRCTESLFSPVFSVFGCPTLKAMRGTTVKVSGVMAQVTCDATGESWQMSCRGSKWYGKASNCTMGEYTSYEISGRILVQKQQKIQTIIHTYNFELIPRSISLRVHAVLGEIRPNNRLASPFQVSAPPLGNSRSAASIDVQWNPTSSKQEKIEIWNNQWPSSPCRNINRFGHLRFIKHF